MQDNPKLSQSCLNLEGSVGPSKRALGGQAAEENRAGDDAGPGEERDHE